MGILKLCSSCCRFVFILLERDIMLLFLTIIKQMLLKHLPLPQDYLDDLLYIDTPYTNGKSDLSH